MKKYISIIFTMFLVFSIHAQSADTISEILESERVTIGQVSYLSAVEQGLMSEREGFDAAVMALIDNGQLDSDVDIEGYIPIVDITYIMAQMWDIKGGIMFRLTKGSPRYAFKQFKADGVIAPNVEPGDYITGSQLLSMYTTCLRVYNNFDLRSVSMESEL